MFLNKATDMPTIHVLQSQKLNGIKDIITDAIKNNQMAGSFLILSHLILQRLFLLKAFFALIRSFIFIFV